MTTVLVDYPGGLFAHLPKLRSSPRPCRFHCYAAEGLLSGQDIASEYVYHGKDIGAMFRF